MSLFRCDALSLDRSFVMSLFWILSLFRYVALSLCRSFERIPTYTHMYMSLCRHNSCWTITSTFWCS